VQFLLLTIGKWKKATETALYEQYVQRSRWDITLRELSGFPSLEPLERQQKETALLFAAAKEWQAQHIIALDEKGKAPSSRAFSSQLGQWQDGGARRIACLIGGDVGFDKSQLVKADMLLSFGAMTWPHLLVRVLLAEQLYRAQTILTNHPYHRD
jgi:23S rRNA (pseudouridine1915-N3)-methyltransferase